MFLVGRWLLVVFLFLLVACAKTQQAKEVMRTGFLDDYSILQKAP